ncbi:hypothetical protein WME76_03180 [Sorangium sp. So ce119]|uniref:hypothetical protein n=1 Tax=Sorangium sp. So ce119 TaxID=3133279 RepID=UPI003F62AC4A
MNAPHRAGLNALLILVAALAGCAPRSRPASFPASSAASPQAAEAPPPRIGVALAEDPPLPGAPTTGWVGLEPARAPGAGADPHQHHHHHQHGSAPPASAPPASAPPASAPPSSAPPASAPPSTPEPSHAH